MTFLQKLFGNYCPHCHEPLHCEENAVSCTKSCPKCHYKEETFGGLGVKIVYEDC